MIGITLFEQTKFKLGIREQQNVQISIWDSKRRRKLIFELYDLNNRIMPIQKGLIGKDNLFAIKLEFLKETDKINFENDRFKGIIHFKIFVIDTEAMLNFSSKIEELKKLRDKDQEDFLQMQKESDNQHEQRVERLKNTFNTELRDRDNEITRLNNQLIHQNIKQQKAVLRLFKDAIGQDIFGEEEEEDKFANIDIKQTVE